MIYLNESGGRQEIWIPLKGKANGYNGTTVPLYEEITENGEYVWDRSNGYSPVTVKVDVAGGKEEQTKSVTITENGTTNVIPDEGKVLSSVDVTVDVPQKNIQTFSQFIYLDKNGSGEIQPDKGTAIALLSYLVDVHPKEKLTQTITENGTTNLTGEWKDAEIKVNVVGGKVDVGMVGIRLSYSTFTKVPDFFDFSNCTDMSYMFGLCSKLTTIPQLDTSKVEDMLGMFYACRSLTTIPQLDTSKVTDMRYMFDACRSLTTIPQLNTSNCTYMRNMFTECSKLTTIPQLDTSKVKDMIRMFDGCTSLTTIPQLDTSKVENMRYMFDACTSLTSLTLAGSLNTSLELNDSPLNEDSIKSVLTAASKTTNTGAKTLTFKEGSTLKDTDGVWAALISECTGKGWSIQNLTLA